LHEFERHSFYSVMVEAMRERGCALCRLVAQASHRYLDAILYEAVNTEEFRAKFRAARGFCPRHTREAGTFANALGTSILYREVLADALARWEMVSAKGGSIGPQKAKCPACLVEEGLVANFIETVYGHIGDAAFLEAYRASDGLCAGHFEALVAKAPARVKRTLVEMEREKMNVLIERLDEFVRKSDYRFAQEPKGDEGHAWLDAIRKSAGGVDDDV
jgi:hypothetical protein